MLIAREILAQLVFEKRGKLEFPEKNPSEQGREPTPNAIGELNPGRTGVKRVLSPYAILAPPIKRLILARFNTTLANQP